MKTTPLQDHLKSVFVQVELGNPGANCARFGICDARVIPYEIWLSLHPQQLRMAKAIMSPAGNEALLLQFPLNGLHPAALEAFFNNSHFLIEGPKILSTELCHALNLPSFEIQAGCFPIDRRTDGWLSLCLPVMEPDLITRKTVTGKVIEAN